MGSLYYSASDLGRLDRAYRRTFVNRLQGVRAAVAVGSMGPDGKPNLGLFFSLQHLGASPALMGLVFRPETDRRGTLYNLRQNGWLTANFCQEEYRETIHRTSAEFPEGVSEFKILDIAPHFEPDIPAPFVKEAPIRLALERATEFRLPNDCVFAVLNLRGVWIDELALEPETLLPCFEGLLHINGLDAYHGVAFQKTLGYERP